MRSFKLLVLATLLAAAPACKKTPPADTAGSGSATMAGSGSAATMAGSGSDTGSAAMAGSGSAAAMAGSGSAAMAGSGSAATMAGSGSDSGSAAMAGSGSAAAAPAADPNADSIVVLASHEPAKPTDPVKVEFTSFKVVKADFDPKKIEGGKAEIEIDPASLKTDQEKRDKHLNTPDFLDTAKYPKITIHIGHVKKKADKTYTAEANVKFRDIDKKYPVTFDVVDQKDDSIRIKSEVKFSRMDFKVGKDPKDPKAGVNPELTLQMQLTLKKT